jgi:hypothetical protein
LKQDGSDAEVIPIQVDGRLFHPRRNEDLVYHFHVDKERWEYYDEKLRRWVHGSPNSPDINIGDLKRLSFRSSGVKEGNDMPEGVRSGKRDRQSQESSDCNDIDEYLRRSPKKPSLSTMSEAFRIRGYDINLVKEVILNCTQPL